MKTRCDLWAWQQVQAGNDQYLILRKTFFSSYSDKAGEMWWRLLVAPIGRGLTRPAWFLLQTMSFLQDGKWLHAMTCRKEFYPTVPVEKNRIRDVLGFDGYVREHGENICCDHSLEDN